jgi:hypothetical protein
MDLLDAVFDEYTDFDFVYSRKAIIYSKNGNLNAARAVIHAGLSRARTKHSLCEHMGNIEFEWGNLSDAVRWWIKSITLQQQLAGYASWHSFVYLAGIATALGEEESSERLLGALDSQRPERVRLNGDGRNRVALKVAREGNAAMRRAIQRLCEHVATP